MINNRFDVTLPLHDGFYMQPAESIHDAGWIHENTEEVDTVERRQLVRKKQLRYFVCCQT